MSARTIFVFGRPLVLAAALILAPGHPHAQAPKVEVTLTNTLAEEVAIIIAASDGSSTREAGKIAPGGVAKVQAHPSEFVMLTTGGAPFQNYAVTEAAAQVVSVAKRGTPPAPTIAAPDPSPATEPPTVAGTPRTPAAPTESPPSAPAATAVAPEPSPVQPASPAADANPGTEPAPAAAATTSTPPEAAPTEQAGPLMGPPDVNGLRWQYLKLEGAKAQLIYGVPETDNVQFVASCASKAMTVDVQLALETGNRRNGAKLTLDLQGEAYKAKLNGAVVAPSAGESLSGVKAKILTDDGLWDALAAEQAISYGTGGDRLRLPLDGSRRVVEAFTTHCSSRKPLSPSAALCKKALRLKSVSGGPKVDVTFVNRSGEYRVVFWIDPAGQQVEMGRLDSEVGTLPLSTWVGHMFALTDGPGNCVEVLTATAGTKEIVVSAKRPSFGPE